MRKTPTTSAFEPGQVVAQPDPIDVQAPMTMPEVKKLPRALILDESIGFMDNGALCMFHEEQFVTNPADIKRLLQHGAKYMEVKLS